MQSETQAYTLTHTHPYTLTHTHTYTLIGNCIIIVQNQWMPVSLSLIHTHTHSLTHSLTHTSTLADIDKVCEYNGLLCEHSSTYCPLSLDQQLVSPPHKHALTDTNIYTHTPPL